MKKLIIASICLSLLGILTAPQASACDGMYVNVKGGMVWHNLGDKGSSLFSKKETLGENDILVAGAIGYRYGYWRAELEYTWRDKYTETKTASLGSIKSSFQTSSYMLNAYFDMFPYALITPYVMAGAGFTKLKYNSASGSGIGYDEQNFTWAIGGGFSWKASNRWNFDLGYRYLDMGDVDQGTVHTHEVYLGARYIL